MYILLYSIKYGSCVILYDYASFIFSCLMIDIKANHRLDEIEHIQTENENQPL